jgi:hypothetical protein
MPLCIGHRQVETQVNLTNRANFNFLMLIGVNTMLDAKLVIDPEFEYTTKPIC